MALSKIDLSALAGRREELLELRRQKRLEPSLRLTADPPLPLIIDMELSKIYFRTKAQLPAEKIAWPEDMAVPIVKEKLKFKEFWGFYPRGFVPGGGSLSTGMTDFLIKQKLISFTRGGSSFVSKVK